jgi:hypothetical protein
MKLVSVPLCCLPVGAESFHRHNLAVGFGGAFPVGGNYSGWRNRPELSLGSGLRLHRRFQAEAGVETVFRPTGVILGRINFDTKDTLFLIPFGGRIMATLRRERLWLSAGASLALDRGHHFRVGATPKFHGINGRSRANRMFTVAGEFVFSF